MAITSTASLTKFKEPVKAAQSGNLKGVIEVSSAITGVAVGLCPVDKGQLRNTITYAIDNGLEGPFNEAGLIAAPADQKLVGPPTRITNNTIRGYVGTNSDHWFPEFGTLRQVAQPFLRPAFDLIGRGGRAADIAVKYGREAMVKEFNIRKTVYKDSK